MPWSFKMPGGERSAARAGGQSASGGDAGAPALAFQRIYDDRFEDVERWVRAFGGRPSDIQDLIQDIFVVAFRRLPDFDDQNVAGWLYQITRRRMRDYRRLSWIKHVFTERTSRTFERSLAPGPDPLEQLESSEKAQLLERLLDRLPGEQRAAFVLFEIEGCSGAEIAQLQQVAVNTVWSRIYKARQALQARLGVLEGRASRKRG
jgi:RNA polymerase sigma-70 factor, ECF subfamily